MSDTGIALFTLGGTIAMAGQHPDSAGGPVVARLTGAELASAVPGLADIGVPLEVQDVEAVPSANLTFAQLIDLVDRASRAVRAGACGVVVTQGTDTLEETAFLIDLLWPHEEPFVLTGAMRNPTLAGPDGPANLLAAALTAAAPQARGLGALVAFNDELHAARWVRKTHSTSTATFASPNAGPIGLVTEGRVRLLAVPPRRVPLTQRLQRLQRLQGVQGVTARTLAATRVALHTVTLDDDGALLDGLADSHQGLVLAAYGVGHVSAALAPVLGALAERMPVVLTSRTGGGPVLRHTYGSPGSETDLQRRGLINGELIDPYKARILLRLLLAGGADHATVTAVFAELG